MRRVIVRFAVLVPLCVGAACSSDETDGSAADAGNVQPSTGPLYPWKLGNSWTYRTTEDGEVSSKVTTLASEEMVGGTGPNATKMAFKVVTKKGSTDQTISWQALEGERVVRYREQSFKASTGELELEEYWEPSKLHFDMSAAHTAAEAAWVEEYKETKLPVAEASSTDTERDAWSVDGVDQLVTVPAGTFRALIVRKAGGSNLKSYWYVPGIGKVKETGGQTEELESYQVSP